jgi:hypothetical protein
VSVPVAAAGVSTGCRSLTPHWPATTCVRSKSRSPKQLVGLVLLVALSLMVMKSSAVGESPRLQKIWKT